MQKLATALLALAAAVVTAVAPSTAAAQAKEVTIAYQDMMVPYRVAQEAKELERVTGYKINWRQFAGGGEVVKAMASGNVQIGEVGSAGVASAVSRGLPLEVFWILTDIGDAEALVARNGSNVAKLQDLKGKKVAAPFNSTTHFHLMVALEEAKMNPGEVRIMNMRPPEIAAAWERGDIDAAFVWDPVLSRIKGNGKQLTSSGQISASTGKATFDAMVVNRDWAKQHEAFVVQFVRVLAAADERYRGNQKGWTPDSAEVKAVSKWAGSKIEDTPAGMALYRFPTLPEQAGKWLAKDGVAVKALGATAAFLKQEKQIEATAADYSIGVNGSYAQKALK